jgi:hypothetical protein
VVVSYVANWVDGNVSAFYRGSLVRMQQRRSVDAPIPSPSSVHLPFGSSTPALSAEPRLGLT